MENRRTKRLDMDIDDFFGDKQMTKRSEDTKERLKQIEDNLRSKGIDMDLTENFGFGNRRYKCCL